MDGNVSLAAAAGYLSHLFGHEIPETVAFFSQTQLMGALNGDNMTLAGWQKAREEGIKTIVLRKSQVCGPSYLKGQTFHNRDNEPISVMLSRSFESNIFCLV